MLRIIAAIERDGGLGYKNKLIWNYPEDLQWFKDNTLNGNVAMGLNTWNSLPKKPLPKRNNIILSNNLEIVDGIYTTTLNNLLHDYVNEKYDNIWFIGGESIYKQAIQICDELYITHINKNYKCDTYFPKIDEYFWEKNVIKENDDLTFCVYKRR